MKHQAYEHIKKSLVPCLAFAMATGFISAILVTLFKFAAEEVVHLSTSLYNAVRTNPIWMPLLVLGFVGVGEVASFILSRSRSCRGGGIPTSVAAIRGIVSFRWFASIIILPFSALLTFLCGLPLGTEGPCVQMGTAVGDGVVKCLGAKKHKGWRRYIMTGGACAGFSIAASSPITAIIFAIEELHKHFSPMLLSVASISVITAQLTAHVLSLLGIGTVELFHFHHVPALEIKLLFAPVIIGVVCGACSIIFTHFYHVIDKLIHKILKKLSIKIVFPILFGCVSVVGFFLSDSLGTGHSLVDRIIHKEILWYVLILAFLVRAIFMMVSNTAGATGGIFLPTLAFGAIIGSLCADAMTALGWIGDEHYILMVVLGISAFLGSTSRIPVTACVFAIEALCGINNVLPIIVATTVALLVVESSGLEDFTDTVIEAKVRSINRGLRPIVVESALTVTEDAFVIGKELRDILWPSSCVVVSYKRAPENYGKLGIAAGDVITVHYKTHHPDATAEEFETLVGEQSEHVKGIMTHHLHEASIHA